MEYIIIASIISFILGGIFGASGMCIVFAGKGEK